jgi:nucleoid-associated protein YgaU
MWPERPVKAHLAWVKFSDKEKTAMAKIKKALKPKKATKPAAPKVERKAPKPVTKKPAPKKPAKAPERRATLTSDIGVQPDKAKAAEAAKPKVIATHKVGKNQTLSHLSLKYYGKTTRPYWKLIHEFNKDVIGEDEKNIWEGLELEIPELPDDLKE